MSHSPLINMFKITSGISRALINWIDTLWKHIGQLEDWHEIDATNEPAFENSWVNAGGAYNTAAFYKDPFKRVHLKGAVDTGASGTTAFTLPEGYRPAATVRISAATAGNHYVEITSAGLVQPQTSGGGAAYLDSISFRIA